MINNNMDDVFEEIYGWKPLKRGAGYELLVGAVLKILNKDASITSNVFVESQYSKDKFQVDNLLEQQEKVFVEVKDYAEKVGRPDVTKLSGALLNLPLDKGIVASVKGFTKNAKQYVEDCEKNPHAKPIDLYIVRPSTQEDIKGRIMEIHMEITMESTDYRNAKFEPCFTEEAATIFREMGFKKGDQLPFCFDGFYRADGSVIETLYNLTRNMQPAPQGSGQNRGYVGKWKFNEPAFIKVRDRLIPVEYLT